MTTEIDYATEILAYQRAGWRVVPLNGKRPTARGWQERQMSEDEIRRWWSWTEGNVGLVVPHNHIVIDVDTTTSHAVDGLATMRDLMARFGALPHTWEAVTGSGGRHLWFRTNTTDPHAIKASLGAGVDVKKPGSLVVVYPSLHPTTGGRYRWVSDDPIAALPSKWRRHLECKPYKRQQLKPVTTPEEARERVAAACYRIRNHTSGQRNNALFAIVNELIEAGTWSAAAEIEVVDAALVAGLRRDETARTIASAVDYQARRRRQARA